MLISGREAAARLAEVGLARRQARLALDAGLVGEPIRTRAATFYDAERVDELVARPLVAAGAVHRACPHGLLVDRRVTDVRHLEEAGDGEIHDIDLGQWTAFAIGLFIWQHGPFPFVATVCGFVVLGGEIVGVRHNPGAGQTLELTEPGAWFGSGAVVGGRPDPAGDACCWVGADE